MSTAVGDSIRARLDELAAEISQNEQTTETLKEQRKLQFQERRTLEDTLKKIEYVLGVQSGNGDGPRDPRAGRTVDYEEIKAAVAGIGRPAKTPEVAVALGTKSSMIARKLKYLVDHKEIGGSKDDGYYSLT